MLLILILLLNIGRKGAKHLQYDLEVVCHIKVEVA